MFGRVCSMSCHIICKVYVPIFAELLVCSAAEDA